MSLTATTSLNERIGASFPTGGPSGSKSSSVSGSVSRACHQRAGDGHRLPHPAARTSRTLVDNRPAFSHGSRHQTSCSTVSGPASLRPRNRGPVATASSEVARPGRPPRRHAQVRRRLRRPRSPRHRLLTQSARRRPRRRPSRRRGRPIPPGTVVLALVTVVVVDGEVFESDVKVEPFRAQHDVSQDVGSTERCWVVGRGSALRGRCRRASRAREGARAEARASWRR